MALHPTHFVAVIGGAVAGSEAAANLAERGIKVAVFERNIRPYGKIEDGLPKWHVKLQTKEENKIDEKLSHPNIFFIPDTAIGKDVDFLDLVENWGFSAVLLANGAWKDRPLPIEGMEEFVGKGLIYQNNLVHWFNHNHEHDYDRENYQIPDNTIVIGGGLASLDVVKIVMLETVMAAFKKQGIRTNILELEHHSISKFLDEHNLTLDKLDLRGCHLFYRRRVIDMPLAQIPVDAPPEREKKVYMIREKILGNFRDQFLFEFHERRIPTGMIVENGHLAGLRFKETEVRDGRVFVKEGAEHEVRSSLVISSIGSIPEPIPGINMTGELYEILDQETGQMKQFDHVFALGNVVTGQGNIKASFKHSKQVANHVLDGFLAWREEDYEKIFDYSERNAREKIDIITQMLQNKNLLSVEKIGSIIEKLKSCQTKVGHNGSYGDWMAKHKLERIADVIAEKERSHKQT